MHTAEDELKKACSSVQELRRASCVVQGDKSRALFCVNGFVSRACIFHDSLRIFARFGPVRAVGRACHGNVRLFSKKWDM